MKNFLFSSMSFLLVFIACITPNETISGQELRLLAGVQVLGEINGGFSGMGVGFENPLGRHFALNADLNVGSQSRGTTIAFKPAVLYYFSAQQKGFFIGPSAKFISLKEKNENDRYDDNLYALGFSLGFKSNITERSKFLININPHKTVGGSNEADVAGISVQVGYAYRL